MQGSYSSTPHSAAHALRILEALCEGYVLAMMAEFEAAPKGEYPCCIRCGGFCVKDGPLCPSSVETMDELMERRRQLLYERNPAAVEFATLPPVIMLSPARSITDMGAAPPSPSAIRVRSPRQIVRNGGGTTIELACYNTALKRLRGNDPECRVVVVECDEPGTYRGVILHSDLHEKEERRNQWDCPVEDANKNLQCRCGGEGHHHDGTGAIRAQGTDESTPDPDLVEPDYPAHWGAL